MSNDDEIAEIKREIAAQKEEKRLRRNEAAKRHYAKIKEDPEKFQARRDYNREFHKGRLSYRRTYRERNRERAIALLGGACADCGGTFHRAAMDFHHVDGRDDDKNISWIHSWKSLEEELKKCVLLCANCHRVRHFVLHQQRHGGNQP
jgi:5-methylcytosine-specific restriction endonuclease McrA